MATMNISLPDEMKSLVEHRVESGLYANASDYIRDLIRDDFDDAVAWKPSATILAALDKGEASGISFRSLDDIITQEFAKFRSE
jgi:antitoxin ParD1/3/4